MGDGLRPLSLAVSNSSAFAASPSSSSLSPRNGTMNHAHEYIPLKGAGASSSGRTSLDNSTSSPNSAATTPTRARTPLALDSDTVTPSRLKRLSLVARRDSGVFSASGLDSPASSSGRASPSSSAFDPLTATTTTTITPTSSSNAHHSSPSPLSPLAATPLRRPRPRPSSISYSPRNERPDGTHSPSGLGLGLVRDRDYRDPRASTPDTPAGRRSTETQSPASKGPLTLADQHADLLRAIAQRERRVTELRQELAQQEQALASLRARWTAIANQAPTSTTTPAPTPRRARSGSTATQRASLSVSSTASLPTVPDEEGPDNVRVASDDDFGDPTAENNHSGRPRRQGPEPEPETALGVIWSVIAQDADDTIQEGKRFWGQLMRTVGAAAGGTVPEEPRERERDAREARDAKERKDGQRGSVPRSEGRTESVRDKLESNLSGLRTMLPVSLPFSLHSASSPATPPTPSSPDMHATSPPLRHGSIRLHRASLSPSPSGGRPLTRTLSGQSTASNASIGSVASQLSAGNKSSSGTAVSSPSPTATAAEKRRNRNTWGGSPTGSHAALALDSIKDKERDAEPRAPSPVNVVLDSVLW